MGGGGEGGLAGQQMEPACARVTTQAAWAAAGKRKIGRARG